MLVEKRQTGGGLWRFRPVCQGGFAAGFGLIGGFLSVSSNGPSLNKLPRCIFRDARQDGAGMLTQWPQILLIGNGDRDEFREVAASIAAHGGRFADDAATACAEILGGDFVPAIILIAQPWPGCFTARDLELLRAAAPLARIGGLLGSWLEGEPRSGKPWPGAVRIYWHQWFNCGARACEDVAAGRVSLWSLPATASESEQIERAAGTAAPQRRAMRPLVGICARERETAEALRAMISTRGWQSHWLREPDSSTPNIADALIFDLGQGSAGECATLRELKSHHETVPIIAICGFPRIEDVRQLRAAGVAAVFSKPFLTEELLRQIEQVFSASWRDASH